jgi:hypothetical protein
MSVHANDEKIKVTVAAIDTVFNEGYRYLDRCGETIVRIRHVDPQWEATATNPQSGQLRHSKKNLVLNFNTIRFTMSASDEWNLIGAESKVEILAKEAYDIYEIINDVVKPGDTIRVGVRFRFAAPADSLDEADRFVTRGARSPLTDEIEKITASSPKRSTSVWVVEDTEKGLNQRVEVATYVLMNPESPIFTGLGSPSGESGAFVDIETFTRPEAGSYDRLDLFVVENFTAVRRIAKGVFQWLRQRQK